MPEQQFQISALESIRDRAAAEYNRAKEALVKAQQKCDAAKVKVENLNEAIRLLHAGTSQDMSRKDLVLKVITEGASAGVTARVIIDSVTKAGHDLPSNPAAAIHVCCEQLIKEGMIQPVFGPQGKLYKRKAQDSAAGDDDLP